ncbi:MAG: glycoside hydrolase family 2 protein [Bacteroidia bacterium]|nr:glycoside hydrolase family 2 protein [Bacteroidia bacterium]MCZ2278452.1 glycoside hydrolase family 2 protein [Bacteroidia bacterium]
MKQLILLLLIPISAWAGNSYQKSLNTGWEFFYKGNWYKTVAPFAIHTDLLKYNFIPDPFYGENEKLMEWIDSTQWKYRMSFHLDLSELKNNTELVFDGIDTYAAIYLNGNLVLKANNMFRQWRVDMKNLLKDQNTIEIVFYPATIIADSLYKSYRIDNLPGGNQVMVRKAQYQFGWDFSPRFLSCGLWQGVRIESFSDYRIDRVMLLTDSVTSDLAFLTAKLLIIPKTQVLLTTEITDDQGYILARHQAQVKTNDTVLNIPFQLSRPILWWCNGKGKQQLYLFHFKWRSANGIDTSLSIQQGIRTLRLIKEKDSAGISFYFSLNNKPVFMKGANYVPQDMFLNRVSDTQYLHLLTSVKEAGMNMIRVWGGGIYEKDIFYKLCDSLGILVWQDFMFACGMYPADSLYLDNITSEANYQVQRLASHPCIALWCGNNEISEGWQRWGWQNDYAAEERQKLEADYRTIFKQILPEAVTKFSNSDYHESSPEFGRGDPQHIRQGDAHNWFVWHDGKPFSDFENQVPRFMSEFGFQSMPAKETLQAAGAYGKLDNQALQSHQKHNRGFNIINEYMSRELGRIPETIDEYISLSQQLQAEGVIKGIRAHLKAESYCMGSLFWQLNDCWPGVTWSAIDYFGRKKKLYDEAKKIFTEESQH